MSDEKMYDVCVIGAGPGGYVAAIKAARNGAKTALVERGRLGGTCLNVGCIPTKTLLAGAGLLHKARHASEYGVRISGAVEADWPAMLSRKADVVKKLNAGVAALEKNAGVDVVLGEASFLDRRTLSVKKADGSSETLRASKFIIATGSRPAMPGFIPRGPRVLDSTAMLDIPEIPKSLLVLGGGVIGCEFACLFAALGTKVVVVEMLPDILAMLDQETVKAAAKEFKALGVEFKTGQALREITATEAGVSGKVGDETVSADYLLVAIGRVPSTDGLNPAAAGIKPDEKGFIRVDSRCRTGVPGIYAIGDVTGRVQLAHMASAMAGCAADNACGISAEIDDALVPGAVYTFPEIAGVGLTQEQCDERKLSYQIGKFPFAALGKALAAGETAGFCKIIADKATDQILGVHIVGPHATDLICEAVTSMKLESTAAELGKAIHPHPTMGEALMEAAHDVHGLSAHVPSKKKKH